MNDLSSSLALGWMWFLLLRWNYYSSKYYSFVFVAPLTTAFWFQQSSFNVWSFEPITFVSNHFITYKSHLLFQDQLLNAITSFTLGIHLFLLKVLRTLVLYNYFLGTISDMKTIWISHLISFHFCYVIYVKLICSKFEYNY